MYSSATTYAEGRTYKIEVANRIAICTVRQCPELDPSQGADAVEMMAQQFERLASFPSSLVSGALIDLRAADSNCGPQMLNALARCVATFERSRRRLVLLTSLDADQRLVARRLIGERAPLGGCASADESVGRRWLMEGDVVWPLPV